jgi:hypothetical protein
LKIEVHRWIPEVVFVDTSIISNCQKLYRCGKPISNGSGNDR